ncbi:MAG TPA: tetratricopeptide repeat protein [Blastocatellia bacterium]|nr:tetratricopeptide repeat protein [Blastocatellia bacterium]
MLQTMLQFLTKVHHGSPMLAKLIFIAGLFSLTAFAQPPNAALLQRYSEEGEQALAERRYEDAEKAYEKLRQLLPGTAEVHARLGLIFYQQGKFAQAIPALQQALKLKPTLPNLDVLLAMSLSETGQYREAIPALQKGFKQTKDAALRRSSGLQLQRAYTGLKQDDKAVEVALELTRAFPQDAEILYHASRLFANFAYLSAVKLSTVAPDSLWLQLAAGEAHESQGHLDSALGAYREVLKMNPRHPGIHFRLGRVQLARAAQDAKAETEALQEFEQELQLDPTNANAAYEAAELHRKAARFDRAAELFALAVKHAPDFEEALVGLGRTLVSLRKPADALPPLQQAIALNAGNEVTWFQLAQAYRALNNAAEQQKAFAEYQRLRTQKLQSSGGANFARPEATKQKIEPESPPKN